MRAGPDDRLDAAAGAVAEDPAVGTPPVQPVRGHPLGDLGACKGIAVENLLDRGALGLPELANRHRQHRYHIARSGRVRHVPRPLFSQRKPCARCVADISSSYRRQIGDSHEVQPGSTRHPRPRACAASVSAADSRSAPAAPTSGPARHGAPAVREAERRGGRGARLNVRPAVLALLLERPMHGYEIIQELDSRTNGIWRPSPGSVYPTLQLLEDEGLIEPEAEGGRKSYHLTDAGRPEAETAAQNPPWASIGDDTMSQAQDFRDAAVGIMSALKQVGFTGTAEQRQKALEVLNDTKRKLYAILADGEIIRDLGRAHSPGCAYRFLHFSEVRTLAVPDGGDRPPPRSPGTKAGGQRPRARMVSRRALGPPPVSAGVGSSAMTGTVTPAAA